MRLPACGVLTMLLLLTTSAAPATSGRAPVLVHTQAQYAAAAKALRPGDTIVLADGQWRDFQILLSGNGTARLPITLTAQTPGRVVLTGQSNLRLAGQFLVVSNLLFRDGWSPTAEVVSFRKSRRERANNSRVTGVVIDAFNKPERDQSDHWVSLYGHDNRFDRNHIAGKSNAGATLVVVRDAEQGLDNRHRIDHNWFGPRPNLGSNGGETIRVGTSHDSQSQSRTLVENNWFEGCDGEVEIVSNKSGGNVYRGNVFFHSRGALVLRHGDGNLVESNVFIGGNKPHTGGIRVINRNQTVRGNYLEGLAGEGFASALSVMYGVPDSPLHRYAQVDNAVIENNTFIDARSLFLGAGMDDERSAPPINSRFSGNLIVGAGRDPLRVLGDLSGIAFSGNLQSPAASAGFPGGVEGRRLETVRGANGLLTVPGAAGTGAPVDLQPVPRSAVGVDWYPKNAKDAALDSGAVRKVTPGEDTLTTALAAAGAGDRLQLAPGHYSVNQVLAVDRPLTVRGPETGDATISFSRPTLFQIERGGSLRLWRLSVSGKAAPDEAGNAVIRIRPGSSAANYALLIERSRVSDLTVNRHFDVISAGKGTLADLIALRDVVIDDVSGAVIAAHAETDDRGTYNAERVEIENSRFRRIGGPVVDLYRGGSDESTFGPEIRIDASTFEQAGNRADASVRLHGVQRAQLTGNRFTDSAPVRFAHTVGEPVFAVARNQFVATPAIQSDIPLEIAQ
ncbi:polysaccharide lyase 6 family protein [Pseudoxanthomonas wuyuanensis]|uniref:Poly(Beta-D-mannuronate) lyase n=1 Tax=Pseudoxanthomonas wuyuanensis TaxID=1073196 RepID=A0A286CX95_9GAMM|nr:polysaccharide lyase 6 family protein [Pseudoxanthomonas wuyuanensis]SOD51008.1 poly(beta-D-mannuronate) lyase [Pseudoxanthomonas wuyuanensis]